MNVSELAQTEIANYGTIWIGQLEYHATKLETDFSGSTDSLSIEYCAWSYGVKSELKFEAVGQTVEEAVDELNNVLDSMIRVRR